MKNFAQTPRAASLFDVDVTRRVLIVKNCWGPQWHVEDESHFTVKGFAQSYPTPRLAAKVARAKGFKVLADDELTAELINAEVIAA